MRSPLMPISSTRLRQYHADPELPAVPAVCVHGPRQRRRRSAAPPCHDRSGSTRAGAWEAIPSSVGTSRRLSNPTAAGCLARLSGAQHFAKLLQAGSARVPAPTSTMRSHSSRRMQRKKRSADDARSQPANCARSTCISSCENCGLLQRLFDEFRQAVLHADARTQIRWPAPAAAWQSIPSPRKLRPRRRTACELLASALRRTKAAPSMLCISVSASFARRSPTLLDGGPHHFAARRWQTSRPVGPIPMAVLRRGSASLASRQLK